MAICMNYSKMTKEDFDRILYTRLNEETLQSIVNIPGVSEMVSKHFNDDTLLKEETPQSIVKYFLINCNDVVELMVKFGDGRKY